MIYEDREDAGRRLAERLILYRDADPYILALPRGGVVVGYEVARALNAPLDVVIARKLGAPIQPEFGFGAVAPGGVRVLNEEAVRMLGLTDRDVDRIVAHEMQEIDRRTRQYRDERPPPDVRNRTAILVDDGLATGVTALAAVQAVRKWSPRRLVLAVPVAPPQAIEALSPHVDELVCLDMPAAFEAVGQWYYDFPQTTDQEVIDLLQSAERHAAQAAHWGGDPDSGAGI